MGNKVISLLQIAYKVIQVSYYFWIYLIRGIVIYSLIPALCTLSKVVSHILQGESEEDIKSLFKFHFEEYKGLKIQSFLFVFIITSSYTVLFYLNQVDSVFGNILTIVIIYILALTLITLTYCANFITFKQMNFNQAFALGFVSVLKNPLHTLSIVVVLTIVIASAYINLVFFIAFAPFLYAIGSKLSLQRLLKP